MQVLGYSLVLKQKTNKSTSDKELRITIANIIYENEDKEAFIKEMDKLLDNDPERIT